MIMNEAVRVAARELVGEAIAEFVEKTRVVPSPKAMEEIDREVEVCLRKPPTDALVCVVDTIKRKLAPPP